MEFKLITNKLYAEYIFTSGNNTDDENKDNYTHAQFNSSWADWLGFYVLYDGTKPVTFCGIRTFGKYARILDRYFVMPEYRNTSLGHKEWSLLMIQRLVSDSVNAGYQPFFSIQTAKKRRAIEVAVKKFNKCINEEFKVLDGLYCTFPEYRDNENTWQNIATISPYSTTLEKKDE